MTLEEEKNMIFYSSNPATYNSRKSIHDPYFFKNSKLLQCLEEAKTTLKKPGRPCESLLTLAYIFTLTAIVF